MGASLGAPIDHTGEIQARLAAIVESSSDAIIGKTLDGTITDWNKAAEELFGFTAGEIIGQSVAQLLPPDRLQEEVKILQQLQRGSTCPILKRCADARMAAWWKFR